MSEPTRVWLVERTFSDDEQNLIILTYATSDGQREYRKERALTSFTGPSAETAVSVEAPREDLSPVEDEATRSRYEQAIARTRADTDRWHV